MIRKTLSSVLRRRETDSLWLPYDMFDHTRTAREVKAAKRLERVYHKGHQRAWNGKEVLASLLEEHGPIELPLEKREALRNLFSIVLWGELAAWKVSAELAMRLEPLEAKMAATSQAHDEARHFYVLYDYLQLLDFVPDRPPPKAARFLERVLSADTLAKKLVGMQLMVEPIALTLFQLVRESQVEPVLCNLVPYFERDEARHVALGVNYLPDLLTGMSRTEAISYWTWQARQFWFETQNLADLEDALRTLGFSPRDAFKLGQAKQLFAADELAKVIGTDFPVLKVFRALFDFLVTYQFPEEHEPSGRLHRIRNGIEAALHADLLPSELVPSAVGA